MYFDIIINPAASSGRGRQNGRTVISALVMEGVPFRVHAPKSEDELICTVRALTTGLTEDRNLLIVGGDGTLSQVLNNIEDFEHTVVSCINSGSGSDFARNIGIQRDIDHAIHKLVRKPEEISLDYGIVRSDALPPRRFLISSGVGYDADICEEAGRSRLKKALNIFRLGKLVYVFIGIKQIFTRHCPSALLYLDDAPPIRIGSLFFAVSMIHVYEGGGVPFCPHADSEDGLLDICLVKSMSKVKLLAAVAAVYFKLHTLFRNITCHRAKKVKIVTKVPQQLHIDGETPAKVRLAEFECAGKLRILK